MLSYCSGGPSISFFTRPSTHVSSSRCVLLNLGHEIRVQRGFHLRGGFELLPKHGEFAHGECLLRREDPLETREASIDIGQTLAQEKRRLQDPLLGSAVSDPEVLLLDLEDPEERGALIW